MKKKLETSLPSASLLTSACGIGRKNLSFALKEPKEFVPFFNKRSECPWDY